MKNWKLWLLILVFPFVSLLNAATCDASLWKHVYHPARLHFITCLTVTGTIFHAKTELDGDVHIQLTLDAGQKNLLNARNIAAQHGKLVLEPICVKPVKQADAVAACRGYHSTVTIPKPGTHVIVTGAYIEDREANHGWREIHPVTSIEVH